MSLTFLLAIAFIVVALLFSLLVFSILVAGITLVVGYKFVSGRRARTAVRTINVTPVQDHADVPALNGGGTTLG